MESAPFEIKWREITKRYSEMDTGELISEYTFHNGTVNCALQELRRRGLTPPSGPTEDAAETESSPAAETPASHGSTPAVTTAHVARFLRANHEAQHWMSRRASDVADLVSEMSIVDISSLRFMESVRDLNPAGLIKVVEKNANADEKSEFQEMLRTWVAHRWIKWAFDWRLKGLGVTA